MTAAVRPGPRVAVFLVGMAALYAACVALASGALGAIEPTVASVAVIIDLTLTSVLWFWWTLVRPGIARLRTAIGLVALHLLAARLLLPDAGAMVSVLAALAALAELSLAAMALSRLGRMRAAWRRQRAAGASPHRALSRALQTALPPVLAQAAATELTLLALAAVGWFRPAPTLRPGRDFSIHRESQWPALAGVLLFLVAAEGVALHLLLSSWSPLAAGLHGLVAAYGALWLLGDLHALRLTPLRIDDRLLHLEIGLRWSVAIPLARILSAQRLPEAPDADDVLSLGLPGGDTVLLVLDGPVDVQGPFGLVRTARRIALTVDRADAFVAALAD
ncbi:MAG: hypothetical protein H6742_08010 [Alphaproteobacteria bacterium]|nr:hypothetical protein [Alphaproteobacteria bacterium]